MINRDDLTHEQREAYDRSYVGSVDRLNREVQAVKRAIFDAMPRVIQRFILWLRSL